MENAGLNQLSEVDTLPDGFVDSSPEPLSPPILSCELEKLPSDSKEDNLSKLHHSDEPTHEVAVDKPHLNKGMAEKTEKLKTFLAPLSEKDGSDDSVEQLEGEGAAIMPDSVGPLSETSVVSPGCSEVKESVTKKCQISETPIQRGSDSQLTHIKDISSSESVHSPNNSKQETSETKCKNSKWTFKSEKEFLECTLRYQQVVGERDSAISVRDKLESLCRELQRQNKMLMDECKRVSTEGQNLRLDLSARFQDAIKDVSNKLDEQKDEALAQLRENEMLRTKLKQFIDQYTLSEQQHEQQLKQKSLELQIADLKMKQHEEKLVEEQSQMKLYEEQVSQLLATEKNLRSQLTADGEKFQQFQDALLKSNEVFVTFKQEIKKMTNSVKELKSENMFLKSKSEKSDITLKELVEERERMKRQLEKTKNQKEKLESLCRSLQAERKLVTNADNSSDSTLI